MLFFLLFIISLVLGFFLPWWVLAPLAFVLSFILAKKGSSAFLQGFLSFFLTWIILSLYKSLPNDNVLAERVAKLFHLPHWSLLVLISGLIGGLVGGMFALSGYLVKKGFAK